MSYTRNEFLKLLGLSATATLASASGFAADRKRESYQKEKETSLKLGLASYTLRKLSLDDVIKISQRLGLTSVALKNMHMPLESSAEQLKEVAAKFKSANLTLYGAGVIYMKTAQEVENTFNYAM